MKRVLFSSNPYRRCGVYEFGRSTWSALQCSAKYEYIYQEFDESTGLESFRETIEEIQPCGIIHNWHPATMPWLSDDVLYELHRHLPHIRHAAIVHDIPAPFHWIDANIHNDPSMRGRAGEFSVGRRLWDRPVPDFDPGPVIGSFGFGLNGKGFQRIIEQVNREFDSATVRLHIPCSDYCDRDGGKAQAIVDDCRRLAKPGIAIEVSTEYLSTDAMLEWLSMNAVNCFFYDELKGRGISSVIDFAISARRPVAITSSRMFRHILHAAPSIVIERSSLKEIIANGLQPLQPFLETWTSANLARQYDEVVDYILDTPASNLRGNRVLTPRDRERLRPAVRELMELSPDIMSRKIPDAVFQNAFIFEQARSCLHTGDRILLVGGYEDPIGPALRKMGLDVTITDPQVDGRDSFDVLCDTLRAGARFDMVISCSVIEHVEDDVAFVRSLYDMLKPGGHALLTTDFRDGWQPGDAKPTPDVRLYTIERLRMLYSALPQEAFSETPQWRSVQPYFEYDGAVYGFCSLAFRRPQHDPGDRYATSMILERWQQESRLVGQLQQAVRFQTQELTTLQPRVDRLAELETALRDACSLQAKSQEIAEALDRLQSVTSDRIHVLETRLASRAKELTLNMEVRKPYFKRLSGKIRRKWKQLTQPHVAKEATTQANESSNHTSRWWRKAG